MGIIGQRPGRLLLGPIVGHTDEVSARIWMRGSGDLSRFRLRVKKVGIVPFVATSHEFGTAIAIINQLVPDRQYRYQILYGNRVVQGSSGSFRTFPPASSFADISFVVISCSDQEDIGGWWELDKHIKSNRPRFVIMMGDQVYLDSNSKTKDVWTSHKRSSPKIRRSAIVEKYMEAWSREPVQSIMANNPIYMMWDDHDVRDGWGSFAPDSPTLSLRYPRGKKIFEEYNAYFEDARDVCWHFQHCHNAPIGVDTTLRPRSKDSQAISSSPAGGTRDAMPFVFRCGRTAVLMIDSRGARDLWREIDPVLGSSQWTFIDQVIASLDPGIDALAIMTPVPIVGMDPNGLTNTLVGYRTDDVKAFEVGNDKELDRISSTKGDEVDLIIAGWSTFKRSRLGISSNIGDFRLQDIDDVRDQWSHRQSQEEQIRLVHLAFDAQKSGREIVGPRGVIFIGGDWHSGGLYSIRGGRDTADIQCLVSSGIGKSNDENLPIIGTVVDESVRVDDDISAELMQFINQYNFGLVEIIVTGTEPVITPTVVFKGESYALGISADIAVLI